MNRVAEPEQGIFKFAGIPYEYIHLFIHNIGTLDKNTGSHFVIL